jgi:hypothetical protein
MHSVCSGIVCTHLAHICNSRALHRSGPILELKVATVARVVARLFATFRDFSRLWFATLRDFIRFIANDLMTLIHMISLFFVLRPSATFRDHPQLYATLIRESGSDCAKVRSRIGLVANGRHERKRRKKPTYICCVDLESAFPSTWRDAIWWRMQEAGITGKLYRAVKSLYEDCTSAVLTSFGPTEWLRINLGTREGAVLSPFLFSLIISPLVRELTEQGLGIDMAGKLIACLLFADDIALIAGSERELRKMMAVAISFFHQWRFTVSASKPESVLHLEQAKRVGPSRIVHGPLAVDQWMRP